VKFKYVNTLTPSTLCGYSGFSPVSSFGLSPQSSPRSGSSKPSTKTGTLRYFGTHSSSFFLRRHCFPLYFFLASVSYSLVAAGNLPSRLFAGVCVRNLLIVKYLGESLWFHTAEVAGSIPASPTKINKLPHRTRTSCSQRSCAIIHSPRCGMVNQCRAAFHQSLDA
jgi:hypothetical protein